MLINHASSQEGVERNDEGNRGRAPEDPAEECKTVDHNFDPTNPNEFHTTGDLVLLYKKIDLGTNLMSNGNVFKRTTPNQHVESIIHDDHDSDSDLSETLSSEDLHRIVNNECIDVSSSASFRHSLCQKLGEVTLQSPCPHINYNRQFLLSELYSITAQNKSFSKEYVGSLLPATLLDYICSKRLEDNSNVYLDNVIKYVKHTIDQLKRISNGEYLTEKAKELWIEVQNEISSEMEDQKNAQALVVSSTSIPLYMKRRANITNRHASCWNEIIHSELDIRSLAKILEKQIVIGVPRSICGSFVNKYCNDDLLVHCSKEIKSSKERLDVVVKLTLSESEKPMNNIRSILFLQKPLDNEPLCITGALPLPSSEPESITPVSDNICEESVNAANVDSNVDKIEKADDCVNEDRAEHDAFDSIQIVESICNMDRCGDEPDEIPTKLTPNECTENSYVEKIYNPSGDFSRRVNISIDKVFQMSETSKGMSDGNPSLFYDSDRILLNAPVTCSEQTQYNGDCGCLSCPCDWEPLNRHSSVEAIHHAKPSDNLRITMQLLNKQDSLVEDPAEDSSPTRRSPKRNRIKSPYENRSYIIEEKKRKRLLEIRQRREKQKFALTENSMLHVSKTKKLRSNLTPQSSSSVTKLSISNKSFYNSIYGQNSHGETKSRDRTRGRKDMKDSVTESDDEEPLVEVLTPIQTNEKKDSSLKDSITEMMFINLKKKTVDDEFLLSENTTPTLSNNIDEDFNLTSHMMARTKEDRIDSEIDSLHLPYDDTETKESIVNKKLNTRTNLNTDRKLTAKRDNIQEEIKKRTTPVDFRKSIGKIYDLINKSAKPDPVNQVNYAKSKSINQLAVVGKSSTPPYTDSGASFDHLGTSSDPTNNSCCLNTNEVTNDSKHYKFKNKLRRTDKHFEPVIPKVFISSKSQNPKTSEQNNFKKEQCTRQDSSNPVKAISKLLIELGNIQKTKSKAVDKNKKPEAPNPKISPVGLKKTHNENRDKSPRKLKQIHNIEQSKLSQLKSQTEDRHGSKTSRIPDSEIVDTTKDVNGEAIRGSSKLKNSRLSSLAEPKKHYVKAHFEQYQAKHGRNNFTDRLQRKAVEPSLSAARIKSPEKRMRSKSPEKGIQKIDLNKQNAAPPSEKPMKSTPVIVVPIQKQFPSKHPNNGGPILKKKKGASGHSVTRPITANDLPRRHNANIWNVCSATNSVSNPNLCDLNASSEEFVNFFKKIRKLVTPNQTDLPENSNNPILSQSPRQDEYCCSNRGFETDFKVSTCSSASYISITKIADMKQRMSVEACQKSSTKNMTPISSTHHVMLLQSGDMKSIVVKASASRELKLNNSDPYKVSELKALSELQKSAFDWTFTQMPMQITTVGYSFPQYAVDPEICSHIAKGKAKFACIKGKSASLECLLTHQNDQCHKGDTGPVSGKPTPVNKQPIRFEEPGRGKLHKINRTEKKSRPQPADASKNMLNTLIFNNSNLNQPKRDLGLKIKAPEVMSVITELDVTTESDVTTDPDVVAKCDVICETFLDNIILNDHVEESLHQNQVNESNATEPEKHDQNLAPSTDNMAEDSITITSSLDILVGLLNEIKNISTCQTELTNARDSNENCVMEYEGKTNGETDFSHSIAINTHPTHAYDHDVISLTSLDKMRRLESNPSIYSYIVSNNGDIPLGNTECMVHHQIYERFEMWDELNRFTILPARPFCVDKEITVQLPERELVSKCTEVPSRPSIIISEVLNDATNTTIFRSKDNVSSEPLNSVQLSSTPMKNKEIGELKPPAIKRSQRTGEFKRSLPDSKPKIDRKPCKIKPRCVTQLTREAIPKLSTLDKCTKLVPESYNSKEGDFDPIMKIKRDVLVTVYSILVFTIFAAMSWPRVVGL